MAILQLNEHCSDIIGQPSARTSRLSILPMNQILSIPYHDFPFLGFDILREILRIIADLPFGIELSRVP